MFKFSKITNQDLPLTFAIILLSLLGLVSVFTTTYTNTRPVSNFFWQQFLFLIVGYLVYLLVTSLDAKWLHQPKLVALIVIFTFVTLVLVLITGEVIYGTKRWINFGAFNFQPSEFAKLTIIVLTANVFSHNQKLHLSRLINLFQPQPASSWITKLKNQILTNRNIFGLIGSVVIIVLLVWIQPSLGNALIIVTLWLILISTLIHNPIQIYTGILTVLIAANIVRQTLNFQTLYTQLGIAAPSVDLGLIFVSLIICLVIGKLQKFKILTLILLILSGISLAVSADWTWHNLLTGYQRDRITSYINPNSDPLGTYWQVNQAKIAIGSGQILGKGLLQGTQSTSGLLPFAYTDFAYAAFAEQFGMVGSIFLLAVLYFTIIRIITIGQAAEDNLGRLICLGVAIMLTLNVGINVGMNLGLMPVTGVPLPLISYGGSSVLVNMLGLGLVQMIHSETPLKQNSVKLGNITPDIV